MATTFPAHRRQRVQAIPWLGRTGVIGGAVVLDLLPPAVLDKRPDQMARGKTMTLEEIVAEHKRECNRFVHGKCGTLACLERDFAKPLGESGAYKFVGCLSYQAVKSLKQAQRK